MGVGAGPSGDTLDARFAAFIPANDSTAFKNALYNCVLFVFLAAAVAGVWAVYHLLYMFLTPMMWAMLLGTILFPLKRTVTFAIRSYLRSLREGGTPLVVGMICMPFSLLDSVGSRLFSVVYSKNMIYVAGSYISLHILTYRNSFAALINLIARVHSLLDIILAYLTGKWMLPVVALYALGYSAWLYLQPADVNKKLARMLGLPVWLVLLAYVSQWFSMFNVLIFVVSATTIASIAAGVIAPPKENGEDVKEENEESCEVKEVVETVNIADGDLYLELVLGACVLLYLVRHPILLTLLLIPLLCTIVKKAAMNSGIMSKLSEIGGGEGGVKHKLRRCVDVAVPGTLRQFGRIVFTTDSWLTEMLEHSMDTVSSCVVIVVMLLVMIVGTGFITVQVHGEVVGLIKLTGDLVNSEKGLPAWLAGAANYTGAQLDQHDIESYVDQGFTQARTWAATQEWFAMLTPDSRDDNGSGGLTHAFEQAIQGVFILSLKMSLFYGMYMWFVHALFDLNIIFIPTVLASLFAAVPLTSPFMVCIPGVLELLLVDETPSAIVFLVLCVAPTMFVDTAFYMEVKGTHPYLTGLAIVGGMYWLGLQGALIGPIILCCVLVLFNMCAGVANSP